MSINSSIKDGEGTSRLAGVTVDHALKVTQVEERAIYLSPEILTRRKLFIDFLRRLSDDSNDMNVDGSSTAQEFVLVAAESGVRWIDRIRVIIEGNNFDLSASGDFRRWGSVAASPGLTNGTELHVEQGGVTTGIFAESVKTMGDLFYYQSGYENFINAVDSQADFLSIDLQMPVTVALPLGVGDRIVCTINDNLVDADFLKFQMIVSGYQEIGSDE